MFILLFSSYLYCAYTFVLRITLILDLKFWDSLSCRIMKDYVSSQQDQQVKAVLKILGDSFALSSNPNSRKGGLIGLAAAAIALGKVIFLHLQC